MKSWASFISGTPTAAWTACCALKTEFDMVLRNYGYDGLTYLKSTWIITESNIPRVEYGEYLGSNDAQVNYLIKSAVACQMNSVDQLHVYQLGDIETE
ncbi:MAG: hypothetical protein IPN76_34735 [Saprospiraceae bacterium]|nr:hypothetical protein [Saprospiraceae bacterium]